MLEILDFSYNHLDGSIIYPLANVPSLRMLQLDNNNISGDLPINGFDSWSNLSKLEMLDLSANYLPTSIISSLSNISSLRELYLDFNDMGGNLPIKELSSLNLEVFSLQGCWFSGSIPPLGQWPSLKALSLANNRLHGTLTSTGLCGLKNLEELDLSFNNISGNLPLCIGNLSYIRLLDMSFNQLQVKFPSSIFERLLSIIYLSISQNLVEGTLSIRSFLNHSYLQVLRLSTRASNFRVKVVSLPFQLEDLELANCIIDAESNFLLSQHKLQSLDLSNTRSKGLVPSSWLLENNTDLFKLDLHQNFFTGYLQLPLLTHEELSVLDISKNNLGGELPVDITTRLPNLLLLNLSKNHFQGPFPLISWSFLNIIDLSINKLVGNILEVGQVFGLITLNLSNNHFSGGIPNSISYLSQLESLDLSHNSLTGEIPRDLTKLAVLASFSVAYNNLSGPILDEKQFSTFDNRSYIGNPNLCGPPLSKSCFPALNTTKKMDDSKNYEGTDYLIFFGSFCLSFVVGFWSFMAVLYFKRNWRYALFNWVDQCGDI